MAEIILTRGKVSIIDDDDLYLIAPHSWYYSPGTRSRIGYAMGRIDGKVVYLHRIIAKALEGQVIDHINRDSLDNRKCNLRVATASENARNSTKPSNKNGYRGVESAETIPPKYRAVITVDGRVIRGRKRNTPLEAALDYDQLAFKHHGSFAIFNFPEKEIAA